MSEAVQKLRLDKWLWHARFFKTRSLAAKVVSAGHVRVNGLAVSKPSYGIAPEAVLTFPQARDVRVIKVLALGDRRGPAPEAQALYEDLEPPKKPTADLGAPTYEAGGRPTKRNRRKMEQSRALPLE